MSKRAERRHHEERIKNRFRKEVKRMWLRIMPWSAKVMQHAEKTALRMAHHPRHDCEMCRMDPKSLKHKHEFEADKKAPFNDE